MANVRKYSDEERKQKLKESQKKYYENNKGTKQKTFSICMTVAKHNEQTEILSANGFTPSKFWHHCIKLLAAGQLPTDSAGGIVSTDTQTQNPNE